MSSGLEWSKRANYAVTELVLFLLASLILFVMIVFSFMYSYLHTNSHDKEDRKVSFFSTLRPLFENVFPTAVAFTPANKETKEGEGRADGNNAEAQCKKETLRVNIVFLGHEELSPDRKTKTSLVRIWVHVYFICLCGLVILWTVSIFSDSVLYRKISSCNDISVKDTDMTCFLLSNENIPEGIQEIIDEENGENKELVPCVKVQKYIDTNNLTYDLEVICYQYQLNPIAAIGVSYGAMKSIAFAIVSVLSFIFAFVNKVFGREAKNKKKNNLEENAQKCSREKIPTHCIVLVHVFFFIVSLAIIAIFAIVVAVIHEVTGMKDSGYDFLRGEKFYSYSVVALIPITIVYLSFVPWWALEPLEEPQEWDIDFRSKDKVAIRNKMNRFVHRALLHQKFSTPLAVMFDVINRAMTQPITNGSHKPTNTGDESNRGPPTEGSNKDKTEEEGNGVTIGDAAV